MAVNARAKTITGQVLKSITVNKLKCINNMNSLSFTPHPLTAILGPNGSGKSTILHAIAGIYRPEEGQSGEDHKLMDFFPRSPDAEWNGSEFHINHTFRRGRDLIENDEKTYGKADAVGSRWVQIYARRPLREVYYLGIEKCVPMIESEKKNNIKYETSNVSSDFINLLLRKSSHVLNKPYTSFNHHKQPNGKFFIGVEASGIRYSSLSMSAGEKKVFMILEAVFKAEKNALILIDELDLLLHDMALNNLISVIHERASEKNLQVIFTTHRESIISLSGMVNIRHVLSLADRSFCFEETKPDAINRLTGVKVTSIEIYVEDGVAEAMVKKVCSSMKGTKFIKVIKYGAAVNAFTILAGTLLRGDDLDHTLFVLDGDVIKTEEEKINAIQKVLTGNDQRSVGLREQALRKIFQFRLPEGKNPEQCLHDLIIQIDTNELDEGSIEIIEAARNIHFRDDSHDYLTQIIDSLGVERSVGLTRIVDLAAKHQEWQNIIADVEGWLRPEIERLRE
ncbi:AAA family ATPase [Winslowiella iniecta]|uniref:RecF/RecN/SMC N terminal domain protein n=1 Tax=Winslowiella iniecta TaxID=1560201 RepID=A0A0L7T1C1_9GAMM|nr:AAA family ATPase [Winslowiella iniecta]KOC89090.1 recF/RecN/SMC N terminal domain protein [Winslowiella iniecta]KOC91021.1 recF/RecN/SMC N terminal domain protein [Winslowiella iniecta]